MPYSGLDRPRSPTYYLLYKIFFISLVVGTLALLLFVTSKVDYVWQWSRVPKYFWAVGEETIRSETDGVLIASHTEGNRLLLLLKDNATGMTHEQVAPATTQVQVSKDTELYQGDIIGTYTYSRPGILLEGLWLTLKVSLFAIILGIVVGLLTGLSRLSDNPALRWGAILYIELVRGSPLLVQIFLWYFVAGTVIDKLLEQFGGTPLSPLVYGVAALSIFTGAYVAEIVRAGIQSVRRGQMEAARSLGMTHAQAMQKIILPQAFRRIMPPLAGQFISLIKDSSLLGVMAVRELTKSTREAVSSSLQSFELWFVCAALYLVLTFTLSVFIHYLEKRAIRR